MQTKISELEQQNKNLSVEIKNLHSRIDILETNLKNLRGIVNRKLYQEPQEEQETQNLNMGFPIKY